MRHKDPQQTILNVARSSPVGGFVWNPYSWKRLDRIAGRMLKQKKLKVAAKYRANQVLLVFRETQ